MNLNQFNTVAASVAQEFLATGLEPHQFFMWAIHKQNSMYELPIAETPGFSAITEPVSKRLQGFINTLNKEIAEGKEIMALVKVYEADIDHTEILESPILLTAALTNYGDLEHHAASKLEQAFRKYSDEIEESDLGYRDVLQMFILVSMADWHADLAVYNRSESLKYGIPLESVQNVVMNSNFTKLGADGLPIKNADGKFEKGPNFVPPEAHISALLFDADLLIGEAHEVIEEATVAEQVTLPLLTNPMSEVFEAIDAAANYEEEEEEDSSYDIE